MENNLVTDLRHRIERLVRRLPAGADAAPTPSAPQPLFELRRGERGFVEAVERLAAMSLDQYDEHGAPLEVRVPWLDATLWFVPDERDAAALGLEGVSRGRVWTTGELEALTALPDRTPDVVRVMAVAKRAIDGEIVEVLTRERHVE